MIRLNTTVLMLAAVMVIAGCVSFGDSRPTDYYLLSAETGMASPVSDSNAVLLFGPVDLPTYLERPQIVSRGDGNQLVLGAFDRWSEPLGENVTRVLAEEIASRLGLRNVYPFEANHLVPATVQVSIQFYRFDGTVGENVTIDARWQIVDGTGEPLTPSMHFRDEIDAGKGGYSGYVSALNEALHRFSSSIAAEAGKLL